jgi:hypothetical protein
MLIEERVPVSKDPMVDLFTVRSTGPVEIDQPGEWLRAVSDFLG